MSITIIMMMIASSTNTMITVKQKHLNKKSSLKMHVSNSKQTFIDFFTYRNTQYWISFNISIAPSGLRLTTKYSYAPTKWFQIKEETFTRHWSTVNEYHYITTRCGSNYRASCDQYFKKHLSRINQQKLEHVRLKKAYHII